MVRRLAEWLPILAFPALFLWGLDAAHRALPREDVIAIQAAAFLPIGGSSPQPSFAPHAPAWPSTPLPHDWRISLADISQTWYRTEIGFSVAPDRLWALFIPRHAMNATVFLNGELMGQGGRWGSPIARNHNRSLLFSIPNGLLRAGINELIVILDGDPAGKGLLREMYAGPFDVLAPYHRGHEFLLNAVPLTITTFTFAMGLLMATLWWLRRHESVYGWFAAADFTWCVHNLNLFVVDIPVPSWLWDWIWLITLVWLIIITVFFVHRVAGVAYQSLERMLLMYGIAGSVILLALSATQRQELDWIVPYAWHGVALLIGAYASWRMVRHYAANPTGELRWLLASGAVMLVIGLRDWLVLAGHLPRWYGYYIHYSALPVMLAFGFALIRRFIGAVNEVESLNRDLERRVEAKRLELEANYMTVRRLEREKLLAEERARIMRDMHDGVGGQMISTISLIESGRGELKDVSDALRAALEDLRVMIDSLDPAADSLPTALGMLRARVQPRLRQAGISLAWAVGELREAGAMRPEVTLNLLRIVQEAIHNAARHASATRIVLAVRETASERETATLIEISDNGQGMPASGPRGRGLDNMRKRAVDIGARLEIESSPGGTTIRILLPPTADPG